MEAKYRMFLGGLAAFALAGFMGVAQVYAVPDPPGEPPPEESPCVDIVGTLEVPPPNKVSLCHFTGGTNVVLNQPSISAFVPHSGHHGDCWKFSDGSTGCGSD